MSYERKIDHRNPRHHEPREVEPPRAKQPEAPAAKPAREEEHGRALTKPDAEEKIRALPPEERHAARVALTREVGPVRARKTWRAALPKEQDPFAQKREPPKLIPPPIAKVEPKPEPAKVEPRTEPPKTEPPKTDDKKVEPPIAKVQPPPKAPAHEEPAHDGATQPMPRARPPEKKPPPEDLTQAQQRIAEALHQAEWDKTHTREWHLSQSQHIASSSARRKEETAARAKMEREQARAAHAQHKAQAKAQMQKPQHAANLDELKQRLEQSIDADSKRVDADGDKARSELTTKLDGERQRLTGEAEQQELNLEQQIMLKQNELQNGAEHGRADLKKRVDLTNKEMEAQAKKELESLKGEHDRLKHEAEDEADKILQKAKDDAKTLRQQGEDNARDVMVKAMEAAQKAIQDKLAEAQAYAQSADESTPEAKLATAGRVRGIMLEGKQRAEDLLIRAKLSAKTIDDTAKKEAEAQEQRGKEAADQVKAAAEANAARVQGMSKSIGAQQEAFIQQQKQRMDDDLTKQVDHLRQQQAPTREAIRKRVAEGTARIDKEKAEGLAKITAEIEKKRAEVQKRAAEAREKLAHGKQQDLKQLEQMVERTEQALDRSLAEMERSQEARIKATVERMAQLVDKQLDKIAAEADKALAQIDKWAHQAIEGIEADLANQSRAVDQQAKTGMAMLELTSARARLGFGSDAKKAEADQKRVAELEKHLPPEVAKSIEAQSLTGVAKAARDELDKQRGEAIWRQGTLRSRELDKVDKVARGEKDAEVEKYKADRERMAEAAARLSKASETGFLKGADKKGMLAALKQCRTKEEADQLREAFREASGGKDLDKVLKEELDEHQLLEARGALSGDPVLKASGALINALGNRHTFIVSWSSSVDEARVHEVLKDIQKLSPEEQEAVKREIKEQTGMDLNRLMDQRMDKANTQQACREAGVKMPTDPDAKNPISKVDFDNIPHSHDQKNIKAAEQIWAAIDDFHFTGVQTGKVLEALKGKSKEEIEAIKANFNQVSGGRDLEAFLEAHLRGDVLVEAQAHLTADPVAIAVGELRQAHTDSIFRGSDDQKIIRVLEGISDAKTRKAVADRYERETGLSIKEMVDDKMDGFKARYDRQIAVAFLDGDPIAAASLRLEKAQFQDPWKVAQDRATGGHSATDNEAIYAVLEKLTDPRDRERVAKEYERRTGRKLDADLHLSLDGPKLDVAQALLDGDQAAAFAGRIQLAGDDSKKVFALLEDPSMSDAKLTPEQRKAAADARAAGVEAWNKKYGREGYDLRQHLANTFDGLKQEKANVLLDSGACPIELDLQLAMDSAWGKAAEAGGPSFLKTWGTDDDKIKSLLQGKSADEIKDIRAKYKARTGRDLDVELEQHLSGRSAFDVKLAMQGEPTTPEAMLARMKAIHEFERNSGSSVTDAISDSGRRMDEKYARVQELQQQLAQHGMLTAEQKSELDYLYKAQAANRETLIENKNFVANTLATVASVVVGAVATVLTGGVAGAIIGALLAAGAGMATKAAIQGGAYGIKDLTQDATMALVQALSAGLLKSELVAGLKGTMAAASGLSQETVGLLFQATSGGFNAMVHTAITDKDAHSLGELFEHATDAFGPAALAGLASGYVSARIDGVIGNTSSMLGDVTKGFFSGAGGSLAGAMTNPAVFQGNWEEIAGRLGESALQGGLHGAIGAAAGSLAKAAQSAMAARDAGRSLDEQKRAFEEELKSAQQRAQHEDAGKSDEQRVQDAKETAAHAPKLADEKLQPQANAAGAPPAAAAPANAGEEQVEPIQPDRIIPVGKYTRVEVGEDGVEAQRFGNAPRIAVGEIKPEAHAEDGWKQLQEPSRIVHAPEGTDSHEALVTYGPTDENGQRQVRVTLQKAWGMQEKVIDNEVVGYVPAPPAGMRPNWQGAYMEEKVSELMAKEFGQEFATGKHPFANGPDLVPKQAQTPAPETATPAQTPQPETQTPQAPKPVESEAKPAESEFKPADPRKDASPPRPLAVSFEHDENGKQQIVYHELTEQEHFEHTVDHLTAKPTPAEENRRLMQYAPAEQQHEEAPPSSAPPSSSGPSGAPPAPVPVSPAPKDPPSNEPAPPSSKPPSSEPLPAPAPKNADPELAKRNADVIAKHRDDLEYASNVEKRQEILDHIERMPDPAQAEKALALFEAGGGASATSRLHEELLKTLDAHDDPGRQGDAVERMHDAPLQLKESRNYSAPNAEALTEAHDNLQAGKPLTEEQTHAVLDRMVNQGRASDLSDTPGIDLNARGGLCGPNMGRAFNQLEALGVKREDIFGHGTNTDGDGTLNPKFNGPSNHYFAAARMPDGNLYLIDPTFAQFLPGEGNVGEIGRALMATPGGADVARQLTEDGYVRLTPQAADAYGRAMTGRDEPFTPDDYTQSSQNDAQVQKRQREAARMDTIPVSDEVRETYHPEPRAREMPPAPAPTPAPPQSESRLPAVLAAPEAGDASHVVFGARDELGRATGVTAVLNQSDLNDDPGGKRITPVGFEKNLDYNRTHLLGDKMGGPNTRENMTTAARETNTYGNLPEPGNPDLRPPNMRQYEEQVEKALQAGQTVRYRVVPIYDGSAPNPVAFSIQAQGTGPDAVNIDTVVRNWTHHPE